MRGWVANAFLDNRLCQRHDYANTAERMRQIILKVTLNSNQYSVICASRSPAVCAYPDASLFEGPITVEIDYLVEIAAREAAAGAQNQSRGTKVVNIMDALRSSLAEGKKPRARTKAKKGTRRKKAA